MLKPTVYLIHLDNKLAHAQHYVGFTKNLKARLGRHGVGAGSTFMKAVVNAGITFRVSRTWVGDRKLERILKNTKNVKLYCPICSGQYKELKIKEKQP